MFYRTLCYGLLIGLLFAPHGGATQSEEREGEGVYVKERCIRPSAHMPIIAFVPPDGYRFPCAVPAVLDTARRYEGVRERPPGSNEGPAVEEFLASVGLGGGYAWCAAYASHSLQRGGPAKPVAEDGSVIRSAGARDYTDAQATISPRDVAAGRRDVPRGSLVIWGVRGSWTGHIGLVLEEWEGRCGRTIEGNTSPP